MSTNTQQAHDPDLFGVVAKPILSAAEARRNADLPRGSFAPIGSGPPGETCKTCKHSCSRRLGKTYWKCALVKPTSSPKTLHRRTGFGWMEWETAIVFVTDPSSLLKRFSLDDRDCLIIGGDRREELATMPKEQLRDWYAANIDGNRNSMETMLDALKQATASTKLP